MTSSDSDASQILTVETIRGLLPHRYPFLLVDRVTQLTNSESITAIKNVTINEPFFNGHFPGQPIMPGVLIIEAMAQATGLLGFKTISDDPSPELLFVLAGVDKAKFKQQVTPGDQLILSAEILRQKGSVWIYDAKAHVDGTLVASAEIKCVATKIEENL